MATESRIKYSNGVLGPLSTRELKVVRDVLLEWGENDKDETVEGVAKAKTIFKAKEYFNHIIEIESSVRPN